MLEAHEGTTARTAIHPHRYVNPSGHVDCDSIAITPGCNRRSILFESGGCQEMAAQHESIAFDSQWVVMIARRHSGAVCVLTAEAMKNGRDPSVFCKMDRSRCCRCIVARPTWSTYINDSSVQTWMYFMCCVFLMVGWGGGGGGVIIQHTVKRKWSFPPALRDGYRFKGNQREEWVFSTWVVGGQRSVWIWCSSMSQ